MEPGVLAEEMDAEGSGAAVRAPEEGMLARSVFPPAESDSPAQTACGSFLHQWLFLSSIKEGSWYQLCRYLFLHS